MIVKEAMHSITKVPSHLSIAETARIMDSKVIGSVLVEENNRVIGITTERDILRKAVAVGRNCDKLTVKEIMTATLITIDANEPMEKASELMAKHRIRRLIVTENSEITGILTARDMALQIRYSLARNLRRDRSEYTRISYN